VSHSLHLPRGSGAEGIDRVVVTPKSAAWDYVGLRIIELEPDAQRAISTGESEVAVLPLAGSCVVECGGQRFQVKGRENVFSEISDFVYVPRDEQILISSRSGGRFALPGAVTTRRLDPAYGPAKDVPVEIRGAGSATRQINNFMGPQALPADRLIAIEVLTPQGNWSSYPPHKHDEERTGEAKLEEIYYFELSQAPCNQNKGHRQMGMGFGLHRLYTAEGDIDLTETVCHQDVVLIPRGYHGPSVAPPGYDMYYLNVLAGPAEPRTMAYSDDPAHGWVRDNWPFQEKDGRLPMTRGATRT
jgi:5-deoxy-glucuronate isomerase